MVADPRPVVLYCRNCAMAVILAAGQQQVTCRHCWGRYFGNEPPHRRTLPVVITESDREYLRSIKTVWVDE